MPTANPRVHVTLAPATDAILRRLAVATGQSKSNIIRELVETAEPALARVAALMTAAKGAQQTLLDDLALGLNEAQTKIETVLGEALGRVDDSVGDLVSRAEAVKGRKLAGAAALVAVPASARPVAGTRSRRGDPPSSNRGVRTRIKPKTTGKRGGR